MGNNKHLGGIGESAVCKYLEREGYRIQERNFYCKAGELDIIAFDKDCLVFVEVKTRSSDRYGMPSEAVSKSKQTKMIKAALFYMQKNRFFEYMSRFDVAEAHIDEWDEVYHINHIQNAFEYSGRYGY